MLKLSNMTPFKTLERVDARDWLVSIIVAVVNSARDASYSKHACFEGNQGRVRNIA